MPTQYIDIMRTTETDLDEKSLNRIEDFWVTDEKELPDSWTGRTTFELLRPLPPVGYSYVEGRLTKTQETTRPGNVSPEIWRTMSKKQKQQAISSWETENKRREQTRENRGTKFVPEEEVDAYTKILAEARIKLALPDVPAMPVLSRGETSETHIAGVKPQNGSRSSGRQMCGETLNAEHQDNVANKGFVSESWMAMVHTPVKDWRTKDGAKQAVDKEWDKLADKKAWLLDTVREYEDVAKEASRTGKTVHFGDLMRLCHVKHSELAENTTASKVESFLEETTSETSQDTWPSSQNKAHQPLTLLRLVFLIP